MKRRRFWDPLDLPAPRRHKSGRLWKENFVGRPFASQPWGEARISDRGIEGNLGGGRCSRFGEGGCLSLKHATRSLLLTIPQHQKGRHFEEFWESLGTKGLPLVSEEAAYGLSDLHKGPPFRTLSMESQSIPLMVFPPYKFLS